MSKIALDKLARTVEELQTQVADLTAKLAALQPPPAPVVQEPPAAAAVPAPAPEAEGITDEVMLAISAAVAAFLGERAHVRAVRLISTSRWSQEGRVSIQASHRLERG
jgi:methylmalonyl-CoA carboxyltransferase 12S subunit